MLTTVGTDHQCKIWDITANASPDGQTYTPACIQTKDLKQGDLFSVQMYADIPWVMAAGGQKGELAIWDTEEDGKVLKHFKDMMPKKARSLKKKADKGFDADEEMDEGGNDDEDSSGFEDVDSDEESEAATQEEMKESPQEVQAKS